MMLNGILGSAIGGLAAGAVALVASTAGQSAPEPRWPSASRDPVSIADSPSPRSADRPSFVQCGPDERPELRRAWVDGRDMAHVACVSSLVAPASEIVTAPVASAQTMVARPTVIRERVVTRDVPRRRSAGNRSWAKSTLLIGGSAGAGAGVGGLVGGKKGALIGAALGGGSAAIYEAAKR